MVSSDPCRVSKVKVPYVEFVYGKEATRGDGLRVRACLWAEQIACRNVDMNIVACIVLELDVSYAILRYYLSASLASPPCLALCTAVSGRFSSLLTRV